MRSRVPILMAGLVLALGMLTSCGGGSDGSYDFSKYDELSPVDYEIPDEVKKTT